MWCLLERRYPSRKSVISATRPFGKALLLYEKALLRFLERYHHAFLKSAITPYWKAWSRLIERRTWSRLLVKRCNTFFALLTERYDIFQLHKPYHEAFVINNPVSTRIFTSTEYFLQIFKQSDRNLYRNWWD